MLMKKKDSLTWKLASKLTKVQNFIVRWTKQNESIGVKETIVALKESML